MNARVSFYKETKFKEAQLGRIPEDWKTAKISKLFNLYKGTTPSTKIKEYWNGKIPFVTPTDITRVSNLNKIYLRETEKYITEKGLASKNLKLIPANSLLFTSRATIGYLAINDVKVTINQGVISLMPKDKDVEITFFYYLFQRLRSLFESLAGGSTYKEISMSTFSDIEIYLPSVLEQKTIAHILLTVDKAIQKTNEIIEKTERLKKGLMQELLTKGIGHKEFKDTEIGRIPKEWEVAKLGDLITYEKGKKPVVLFDRKEPETLPYLTADNLRTGIFTQWAKEDGNIIKVNEDDLLLIWDGFYCGDAFIGFKGILSSTMIKIEPKKPNLDKRYLYYFLKTRFKILNSQIAGMYLKHVSKFVFESLKVPLPPLSEQEKIAEVLSVVDKKLEMEREEKQRLEKIKQALMDLLLTGKVRLKVKDDA